MAGNKVRSASAAAAARPLPRSFCEKRGERERSSSATTPPSSTRMRAPEPAMVRSAAPPSPPAPSTNADFEVAT